MSRVPAEVTAFAHRSSRIMVNVAAVYERPDEAAVRFHASFWRPPGCCGSCERENQAGSLGRCERCAREGRPITLGAKALYNE
jgi:hypothetical protein